MVKKRERRLVINPEASITAVVDSTTRNVSTIAHGTPQGLDRGNKEESGYQNLQKELIYLRNLINKSKGQPTSSEHNKNSTAGKNRFSWSKNGIRNSQSASQGQSFEHSFPPKGHSLAPPLNRYQQTRSQLKWTKPRDRDQTNANSKFKYVAKKPGAALSAQHGQLQKASFPNQSFKKADKDKTSGQDSKNKLVDQKSLLNINTARTSTNALSSQSLRLPSIEAAARSDMVASLEQTKRMPHSKELQVAMKNYANKSGAVTETKTTIGSSPRTMTGHTLTSKKSKTVNNLPSERTHSQSMNETIAKLDKLKCLVSELDKCKQKIASLKKLPVNTSNASDRNKAVKTVSRTSGSTVHVVSPCKASGRLEKTSTVTSHNPKNVTKPMTVVQRGQDNSEKIQMKLLSSDVNKIPHTTSSGSPTQSSYKWTAPITSKWKTVSDKQATSKPKAVSNQKSAINSITSENLITLSSPLLNDPRTTVVRTKYKMRKHLSDQRPANKVHRRPSKYVFHSETRSGNGTVTWKSSRYKFVKSESVSVSERPTTSRMLVVQQKNLRKSPVGFTSRFKKVKGRSSGKQPLVRNQTFAKKQHQVIPHRSQLTLKRKAGQHSSAHRKKRHIVIPHRSQLKLVKKHGQHGVTKKRSPHLQLGRQPSTKIVPKNAPVVRSRYKMRKVGPHTSTKASPKPVVTSPYKWHAKKADPIKATSQPQRSFMQRRIQYVLTHTPVLLRSRFSLVNSPHNSKYPTPLSIRAGLHMGNLRARTITQQPIVKKTRTKIVRKTATPYTKRKLHSTFVNAKGVHFHQSKSGKSLRRISHIAAPIRTDKLSSSLGQSTHTRVWTASAPRHGNKVSSTQYVANRVLRRTIQAKINRNVKNMKSQPYCKFYNRYGRCHRGDACPYIHDPDKVAVCTRFLRGTCKKTDGTCPFSHKVSKDKMPVCVYFLKGVCNRDDCPYSHVKVSKTAEVCPEFLHGYCPRGAKCKMKHTLECAEFARTGQCKLGKKCPMWHRSKHVTKGEKRRRTESQTASIKRNNESKKSKRRNDETPEEDDDADDDIDDEIDNEKDAEVNDEDDTESTDGGTGRMPSYIALDRDSDASSPEDWTPKKNWFRNGGSPELKIRPLFALPSQPDNSAVPEPRVTMETGSPIDDDDDDDDTQNVNKRMTRKDDVS